MKELTRKLKKLLNNKNLLDLIIFGSLAKGKIRPTDIDMAAIVEGEADKNRLRKEIKEIINKDIDLQIITIRDYTNFLWITLIREGFSVKHNAYLHKIYRIKPVVLYKYSLKQLTVSKKVMFERAIKNFEGLNKLSNRVVLVLVENSGKFSDFLKSWGLDFDSEEYGLVPLVRKEI